MADVVKLLAQANPAAATLTDIYTCPAAKGAMVGSLVVCNQGISVATFRLSVALNGVADTPKQYLFFNVPVAAADSYIGDMATLTMAAGDVVRVYSSTSTLSFNLSGMERDQ